MRVSGDQIFVIVCNRHCVKSSRMRSYSGPYSFRMRENADQSNSEYGQFSRSENSQKNLWIDLYCCLGSCYFIYKAWKRYSYWAVFRTLSNISDEVFYGNSQPLSAMNYFFTCSVLQKLHHRCLIWF